MNLRGHDAQSALVLVITSDLSIYPFVLSISTVTCTRRVGEWAAARATLLRSSAEVSLIAFLWLVSYSF